MAIRHMRIIFQRTKATDTHSEYVILISFSMANVVARTRLNVTLYVYFLSSYLIYFTGLFNQDAMFVFWCDSPHSGSGPPHSRGFQITHDAPQSVALLWASNQLVAETST